MHTSPGLVAFLLAGALVAQNHVSYPQDSTTGGNGNNIAFGVSTGASLDEGRYQQLIPRTYLPSTGAAIIGVEVVSMALFQHNLTLQSLQVTLSHDNRTQLDPNAGTNLPSPVVVLAAQNTVLNYTPGQWAAIPFTTPFVYDGTSDLVIDVQKIFNRNVAPAPPPGGSSMSRAAHPGRPDLPVSRWAFGSFGSGAANAPLLNFFGDPLILRLQVGSAPTTVLRGDRVSNGNFFAIGNPFDVEIRAQPSQLFGVFVSTSFSAPTPFPPVGGLLYLAGPQTLKIATTGPSGIDTTVVTLPSNPGLVGTHLTWQSAVVSTSGTSVLFTCATDLFVNP